MRFETVEMYKEKLKSFIIDKHFNKVVIYGAGTAGKFLYHLLQEELKIICFIDEFSTDKSYQDIPIFKLNEFKSEIKVDAIIITVLTKSQNELVEKVLKMKPYFNQIINLRKIINGFLKSGIKRMIEEKRRNKRPVKLIIGAGLNVNEEKEVESGWISTDIDTLDITKDKDWAFYFKQVKVNTILAEHVFEHLTNDDAQIALGNCYKYLEQQGYIRVAVPDGFHSNSDYIDQVKPGGKGSGSDDHKVLYNYQTISILLENVGFKRIVPLEFFDVNGVFQRNDWNIEDGFIKRSYKYDKRNYDHNPNYTSIIIDGFKR